MIIHNPRLFGSMRPCLCFGKRKTKWDEKYSGVQKKMVVSKICWHLFHKLNCIERNISKDIVEFIGMQIYIDFINQSIDNKNELLLAGNEIDHIKKFNELIYRFMSARENVED